MDFIKEKIRVSTNKLKTLIVKNSEPVSFEFIPCKEYKKDNTPPPANADWQPYTPDLRFSGIDTHYWVHMKCNSLEPIKGCEYRLQVKTGREGQWDATNPQCTVFVNSTSAAQALDTNHTWLPLEAGKELDIYIYVYTGMGGINPELLNSMSNAFNFSVTIETIDLAVESLYYD